VDHDEFLDFYRKHLCKTDRELMCAILWCVKGAEEENSKLRQRIADLEDTVETVSTGGRIKCPTCGQNKPCICDHG
jgi:hypothetical protein